MDYNNIVNNVVIPLIEKFGTIHYIERGEKYNDLPYETLENNCYGFEKGAEYGFGEGGEWEKKFDPIRGVFYWENTVTGEITYDEPVELVKLYPVKSVKDAITEQDMVNSLVLATDSKYYIAPEGIVPMVGDIFIDNDVKYSVYYVETLQPANLTVLYTIYCRIIS